jgi:hypothetical protein
VRDKRTRKTLRRFRQIDAREFQKLAWARMRKFKAQGIEARRAKTEGLGAKHESPVP